MSFEFEFKHILESHGIVPRDTLVFNHNPNDLSPVVLASLAHTRPDIIRAYQQDQRQAVEKRIEKASHVATFINLRPSLAYFVALFKIGELRKISCEQYWRIPIHNQMKQIYGFRGFLCDYDLTLLPDLHEVDTFCPNWKGRLVLHWRGRRIDRLASNSLPVADVLTDSAFVPFQTVDVQQNIQPR